MAYTYASISLANPEFSLNETHVVGWKEARMWVVIWKGIMLFSCSYLDDAIASAKAWAAVAPQLHGTIRSNGIPYLNNASQNLLLETDRKLLSAYLCGVRMAERDIANNDDYQ